MKTRYEEMRQAALEFHNKYPQVMELFEKFAFDRINRGFQNYGAKSIMERIRWETDQANVGDNEFKIGNNHTAFYARAFMKKYPQYEGFFRTRLQKSKEKPATHRPELRPSNLVYLEK